MNFLMFFDLRKPKTFPTLHSDESGKKKDVNIQLTCWLDVTRDYRPYFEEKILTEDVTQTKHFFLPKLVCSMLLRMLSR